MKTCSQLWESATTTSILNFRMLLHFNYDLSTRVYRNTYLYVLYIIPTQYIIVVSSQLYVVWIETPLALYKHHKHFFFKFNEPYL